MKHTFVFDSSSFLTETWKMDNLCLEIEEFFKTQDDPNYSIVKSKFRRDAIALIQNQIKKEEYDDPLYNEILDFTVQTGKISASLIQRRFRLGYNRAARIIDLLEERGVVGPQNGSKPREVLIKMENTEPEE